MSPGRLRAALVVALAVLLASAGYWLFGRGGGASEEGYVTEPVDRGPIAAVVTATGTVNPVTMVQVGTYVSGPIRAIDVDYNSPVRKGQRVAKIDPAPFQVKVDQAQANLANARARVAKSRADLELKKLTLERSRQLLAQNLISQSELDTAGSDHAQAAAQLALDLASVDQVKAALEEARINLAYTDIVSPVDGVVVSRNVDVGQTVAASFQTPTLFEIAQDLAEMQVDANVSESDIGSVHAGQTASFGVDAYPGRVFEGTVVQVRNAPLIVQNVVTYDVVVQVDNSSLELKPGMTATVTITTDRRDDAIRVPVRALRFKPEAASDGGSAAPAAGPREAGEAPPTVWLAEPGGRLRPVEIRTGLRNDRYVELLSDGLAPGDPVAVAYRRPPASEPPARSPFAPSRPR